jgi:hypothetical protein
MKLQILLMLLCATATVCVGETTNQLAGDDLTGWTNRQSSAFILETPPDTDMDLQIPLGLWKRQLRVYSASNMKLTVTCRVYRNGVLDTNESSRQVHGSTMPVVYESLQLGVLDPDEINPGPPCGKVKVFGSIGPLWIDKSPPKSNSGCSINIPTTGEVPAGQDALAMELRYGAAVFIGGSGSYMPTNTNFRVTLDVRIDPLSDEEKQMLSHQSNFNEAYRVDR